MKLYKVRTDKNWIYFNDEQEYIITKILEKIIKELSLQILAYNICKDHIHMILILEEKDLNSIIWKLKWKSSKLYRDYFKIEDKINLWWQKFNYVTLNNRIQLFNTINYIKNNRNKHWLEKNIKLENINFCKNIKY